MLGATVSQNRDIDRYQVVSQVITEKRPIDTIAVGALARVLETVGLSMFMTYWGTRTSVFD